MSHDKPETSGLRWYRVADPADLPEGRVITVVAGHKSLALTHHDGKFNALDNACPHKGGPRSP
jgi:nitrite reductase/ring-hydroxylating ferredoxin subunit